jgi:hypothetical protein
MSCFVSLLLLIGLPYPDNVQTGRELESIVREHGSIPATIAIINGTIKIGKEKVEERNFFSYIFYLFLSFFLSKAFLILNWNTLANLVAKLLKLRRVTSLSLSVKKQPERLP